MNKLDETNIDLGYTVESQKRFHLIWGDGFMSPGGAVEVARIVSGRNIAGCKVLDVGSGTGGPAVALVQEHGAREVIGIDLDPRNIETSSQRVRHLHLEDRIQFQLVDLGPLPFAENTFDVVFSKDSLIHTPDKAALYAEIWRVLRPGGLLLISDWLTGDEESQVSAMKSFIEQRNHHYFFPVSLRTLGAMVEGLGFTEIELEDRHEWYQAEALKELQRVKGSLQPKLQELEGDEGYPRLVKFWESIVEVAEQGGLRPGHLRAVKPIART
jgi:phosphoethanolamine N-methyltransferase